jgi:hypothetical protein
MQKSVYLFVSRYTKYIFKPSNMARDISFKKLPIYLKYINFDPHLKIFKQDLMSQESLNNLLIQKNQFNYLFDFSSLEVVHFISNIVKNK